MLILIVSNSFIAIMAHAFQNLEKSGEGNSTFNTNIKEFRLKILFWAQQVRDVFMYVPRKLVDEGEALRTSLAVSTASC